jgi:hypothetical protein
MIRVDWTELLDALFLRRCFVRTTSRGAQHLPDNNNGEQAMTAQQNKYWTAQQQARIPETGWVTADWGTGAYCANRLRMLNGAFEIYYRLKTSIDSCEDAELKKLMTEELNDAGTDGFGTGVRDLDDAFQHWLKPGPWTDNNTKTYMRANGIFGALTPSIKGAKYCWGLATNSMDGGPEGAVNFFNSLDKKMADLQGSIRGHNAEVSNLATAVTAKNGAKTGDALHAIAGYAKKAKRFLFLAPKPNDAFLSGIYSGRSSGNEYGSFTPYVDLNPPSPITGQKPPSRSSSTTVAAATAGANFLQATMDLDTFLTVHQNALRTGIFDNKTATEFAALTVVLGKVPILGSFYAEMVSNLPGFFASMKDMFEEHYRRIDRETRAN